MKKLNLQINYLTATLIFALVLLLIGTYFLTYPILKNTALYSTVNKTYQDNVWATFTREVADYRLIRNGLLYRFVTTDSSRFLENKEKNSKTFQQIIASVKFFD